MAEEFNLSVENEVYDISFNEETSEIIVDIQDNVTAINVDFHQGYYPLPNEGSGSSDWNDITNLLRVFIKEFLDSGEKLFLSNPLKLRKEESKEGNPHINADNKLSMTPVVELSAQENAELEERIKQMLDEYVRPAVEGDGGAIDFKSFSQGVVTVVLKGSCSGCPSSTLTLKAGIENLLKRMIPEVTEVMAEQA